MSCNGRKNEESLVIFSKNWIFLKIRIFTKKCLNLANLSKNYCFVKISSIFGEKYGIFSTFLPVAEMSPENNLCGQVLLRLLLGIPNVRQTDMICDTTWHKVFITFSFYTFRIYHAICIQNIYKNIYMKTVTKYSRIWTTTPIKRIMNLKNISIWRNTTLLSYWNL